MSDDSGKSKLTGERARGSGCPGADDRRAVFGPLVAPMLVALAGTAPSCTHDFSAFDVSGAEMSGGGETSSGGSGAGGTPSDASVSDSGGSGVGGSGGSSGGASSGGTIGAGGASGGAGGGAGGRGTGGTATGGSSSGGSGGRASGGAAGSATGGGSGTGGGTGGAVGTGGSAGTGGSDAGAACAAIFGTVPGYLFCSEDATTCGFVHADTTASTCQAICMSHGGPCVSSQNSDPGSCAVTGPSTCTTSYSSAICVCSKR